MKKTHALSTLVKKCLFALSAITLYGLAGYLYMLGAGQLLNQNYTLVFLVSVFVLGTVLFVTLVRPAYLEFKSLYSALIESEGSAKSMTQELNKLYNALGKSYQDLEAVNLVPEDPSTLLRMNAKGEITYISSYFRRVMAQGNEPFHPNLYDWLNEAHQSEDFVDNLKSILTKGDSWSGELQVTNIDGDLIWWDISLQPVKQGLSQEENILAIGRDITEIKEAKQRSREINRELIEKQVKEQQYRSVLILEGQEEERKRISQEIHDGIGQMLTGLKLNLEGITLANSPAMKQRLRDTKMLMKSILREIRRVSFNLTPSSLDDFGLAPAMKKISQEVTALTKTTVIFENRSNFINRLDKNIETNLYRIVQEAVNNGIKYAEADKIVISFDHSQTQLTVKIEDDGKGFEIEKLSQSGHFAASGHGIFNMKERAAFINSLFEIQSLTGVGTKISIKVPLT
ncbi:MAG: sensor histidine kinase [Reichenbachiella sp.]|uniref:PAS domain-containing sensor histidine kinase n=1 Tax=Reichenbachiella sp. TaxID=2184521 RepID=UPI003266DC14